MPILKSIFQFKYIVVVCMLLSSCSNLPNLDIGASSASQSVVKDEIAKGLTFYNVNRDLNSSDGHFTLSSQVLTKSEAKELTLKLESFRFTNEQYLPSKPQYKYASVPEFGPDGLSLGVLVQFGIFKDHTLAKALQSKLLKADINLAVLHTSLQPAQGGPFEISLLKLETDKYKGQLIAALGHNSVAHSEKTSVIAKQNNAIAAVNAGFFVFDWKHGILGDPAGISVIDGHLVSEAVSGRPALLIRHKPNLSVDILQDVKTRISLTIGNNNFLVDGINRSLGKILNCGQQEKNSEIQAVHDHVCETSDEIVIYTHYFGDLSLLKEPSDLSFFIDEQQKIYQISDIEQTKVPKGHYFVQAIGEKAKLLTQHIRSNQPLKINIQVESKAGEVKLNKGDYMVNGGPTLLIDGKENIQIRAKQGWDVKEYQLGKIALDENDKIDGIYAQVTSRKHFYHNWMVNRHPRTALGITKEKEVYILVVYGRNPGISVGASVTEMANIMKSLGVVKAINLDGGGSSIMVVDGKNTGTPSDLKGERSVGDVLLFIDEKPSHQ